MVRRLWMTLPVLLGLLAGGAAAAAEAPAPGPLERVNRWVHDLNLAGGAALSAATERLGGARVAEVLEPLGRAAANLVNEPIGVVSELVAGEPERAWFHVQRFAINTTAGLGGLFDRARGWGLEPRAADLGLALCRRGVPAGPFVMVPVLGPRTLRDAVADVVLGNLIVLAVLNPLIGVGLSVETVAAVVLLEEVALLAVMRELDPDAAAVAAADYETARDTYLARRAARCAAAPQAG